MMIIYLHYLFYSYKYKYMNMIEYKYKSNADMYRLQRTSLKCISVVYFSPRESNTIN